MSKYVIDLRPDCKVVQQICAIDKGINIGLRSIGLLDELTDEYVKKNFKDLLEGEYQRGLEDGKAINDKGCEGCKYQANKELTCPCSECANNYKNQWTAKSPVDDGFVRGDVVVDENGIKGIVVSSDNDEDSYFYVLYDGCQVPQRVTQRYYKKTGEHYYIDKYLKEINRSKTDDVC